MTRSQRLALVAAAVVLLIGAFVLAKGNNSNDKSGSSSATTPATVATSGTTSTTTKPATPAVPVVQVKGGQPVGGVQKLTFNKGDTISFTVASDTADEIHVHGYDVHKDVTAGGRVTFTFPGSIDGIFVVELENAGVQIASLHVNP